MITGTTGSWTALGTAEIGALERTPVFQVLVDFYGSAINRVNTGSFRHTDFTGTPSWLTVVGSDKASKGTSVSMADGTCAITSGSVTNYAYIVGSFPTPTTGTTVVRTRAQFLIGTSGSFMYPLTIVSANAQPSGALATGSIRPDEYHLGTMLNVRTLDGVTATAAGAAATDYIWEAALTAGSAFLKVYNGTLGSIVGRQAAHTWVFATPYLIIGDPRTDSAAGTLSLSYAQIMSGTSVQLGNLGSGYVVQMYGTDNAVIGSLQSAVNNGTVSFQYEWPQCVYLCVFEGTAQTGSVGREPASGNGTFFGGDLFNYGDDLPYCRLMQAKGHLEKLSASGI